MARYQPDGLSSITNPDTPLYHGQSLIQRNATYHSQDRNQIPDVVARRDLEG